MQLWIEEHDKAVWHLATKRLTPRSFRVACGWEMTPMDTRVYPQKSTEAGPPVAERCRTCVGDGAEKRQRVVVVNDDPGVLDLYRDMLRELNYDPVAMITTGIATEQIRAHQPDAVILDLQVGEQAEYGLAMAIQLRSDSRMATIPIVICTANAEALDGHRQTMRDIGVPMVLKPIDMDTLSELLRTRVPLSNRPIA